MRKRKSTKRKRTSDESDPKVKRGTKKKTNIDRDPVLLTERTRKRKRRSTSTTVMIEIDSSK